MRILVFLVLFVVSLTCCTGPSRLPQVKDKLSDEQRLVLTECFRLALEHSEVGAVLFGNKPVCIDGSPIAPYTPNFLIARESVAVSEYYRQGMKIWQSLDVEGTSYSLVRARGIDSSHPASFAFLWVNHRALLEVVDQHLSLFRMVLGPEVTPGTLLAALTQPNVDFFEVLKDNRVLVGIVLGYGLDNALYETRLELLASTLDASETLPYRSRYTQMDNPDPDFPHYLAWEMPPGKTVRPSPGYQTIHQEYAALQQAITISRDHPSAAGYKVPWFGCIENCDETAAIIQGYRVAADKTERVLRSGHVLDEVLNRLCE